MTNDRLILWQFIFYPFPIFLALFVSQLCDTSKCCVISRAALIGWWMATFGIKSDQQIFSFDSFFFHNNFEIYTCTTMSKWYFHAPHTLKCRLRVLNFHFHFYFCLIFSFTSDRIAIEKICTTPVCFVVHACILFPFLLTPHHRVPFTLDLLIINAFAVESGWLSLTLYVYVYK